MHLLLSPLTWCLLALALLQWPRLRQKPAVRRALITLAVVGVGLMTPLGANPLVGLLEREAVSAARAPGCSPDAAQVPRLAIVLSGGFQRAPADAEDYAALTRASVARAVHAARLVEQGRARELLVSGGASDGMPLAESTVMASLIQRLGVPPERIRTETRSSSTWSNAEQVRALMPRLSTGLLPGVQQPAPWLVTSALHMPRALLAFRAAGVPVCAAPTDWRYVPPQAALGYVLPQHSALDKAERSLHELLGYAAYRLRQAEPARAATAAP